MYNQIQLNIFTRTKLSQLCAMDWKTAKSTDEIDEVELFTQKNPGISIISISPSI